MQTLAFNTGRTYTEHGQRIAAQRLDCGAIIMLDIDRGIDYILHPTTQLTSADIMRAYDLSDVVYPADIAFAGWLSARDDERAEECSNPTWGA